MRKVKFADISEYKRKVLITMFPKIKDTSLLSYEEKIKEVKVTYGKSERRINIVNGKFIFFDMISLPNFLSFLKVQRVSKDTINKVLLYHYGDETVLGNGTKRLSQYEIRNIYSQEIKEINHLFNKKEFISRFTKYLKKSFNLGEYFYFTDSELLLKTNDLLIEMSKVEINSLSIHIGPFIYEPKDRNSHFNSHLEYYRNFVVFRVNTRNINMNI